MWNELPENQKQAYKKLILSFASLTDMFAQKATDNENKIAPIINSKFQETAFQRSFNAVAEDIGNTSYDASLQYNGEKYLIGIKTFGIESGDQKIAQFKAKHADWASIIDVMRKNATNLEEKEEIDKSNESLYLNLARRIGRIRNARIDSSFANIKGFLVEDNDVHIHSIYHVLMPSVKTKSPKIFVGEISYDKIDVENIKILGCTGKGHPTNFYFNDGKHTYKYTASDSQLHMNFRNKEIVCDEWDVKYAEDSYSIFGKIADMVYPESQLLDENEKCNDVEETSKPIETYCWTIWNKNGEVERYSGFNSFYGTGSKMGKDQRQKCVERIKNKYIDIIDSETIQAVVEGIRKYLLEVASSAEEKRLKTKLRENIVSLTQRTENKEFENDVAKLLFRPMDEMYIPIPEAAKFHKEHPSFFGENMGNLIPQTSKLLLPKEQRRFNLIFEPSGDALPVYITQDNGKAIESAEKQTYLGEWILRGVFQLEKYEPLTSERLIDLNINGLRFSKYQNSDDIHVEFIWIDENNPPEGFIRKQ